MSYQLYVDLLKDTLEFLAKSRLEDAANRFTEALIELSSLTLKEKNKVQFSGLTALFQIDQALSKTNRTNFCQKAFFKDFNDLPKDFEVLVKVLKNYPSADDLNRINQLTKLSEQEAAQPGIQYFVALALQSYGDKEKDISIIRRSMLIFEQLAPLTENKDNGSPDSDTKTFTLCRINALLSNLRLLSLKEAVLLIESELNKAWSLNAPPTYHDHLIMRREALSDALRLKEQSDKDIAESSRLHQIKHIELLVIFFPLIALVVGFFPLINAQKTLFDGLMFLLGLSLGLIAAQGIVLGLLADKPQRWWRFGFGGLALVLLCGLAYLVKFQLTSD